jgi:RND family efflux transporter MFP subunit
MPDNTSALVRRLMWAGIIGGVAAIVIVGWGVLARARAEGDMQASADERAIPVVRAVSPTVAGGGEPLQLPGQLQAYNEAPIYARVSGYIRNWDQDIGARVKQGQLLAMIDAPELDQQLAEAKANLATAEANQKLAQVTSRRFNDLVGDDAVSRQDADEKSSDYAAKSSVVQAAQANVDRLQALEAFKRIVAPFDGVVTVRNANIGALVNAGAAAGSALFSVADVHKLRFYVQAPQADSAAIHPGMTAALTLPQFPGRTFQAQVVSDAGAVNGQSGTLLVELQVDNPDSALKPGDYAEARIAVGGQSGQVMVPASSLIFRRQGLQVAVLDGDHVRLRSVTVARDDGGQVALASGVGPADKVIDSPPDSLEDGDKVRLAQGTGHAA